MRRRLPLSLYIYTHIYTYICTYIYICIYTYRNNYIPAHALPPPSSPRPGAPTAPDETQFEPSCARPMEGEEGLESTRGTWARFDEEFRRFEYWKLESRIT